MLLAIKASPHWDISEILANQYVAEVGVRKEKSLNIQYVASNVALLKVSKQASKCKAAMKKSLPNSGSPSSYSRG